MRNFFPVLLLLFAMPVAWADTFEDDQQADDIYGPGFYHGYLCDECRDPDEYPMDFVAFAYNAYFGDEPWLWHSKLGWPFRIYNMDGEWVVAWFEGVLFDVPSLLPELMQVMIRKIDGQVLEFSVLQGGPDLPIGEQVEPPPCSCVGIAGEGSDGDEDDYEDFNDIDDLVVDEREPRGVVEIVDPDENGEFPDFEMEL